MFNQEFDHLPDDIRVKLEAQLEQAVRLIARKEKGATLGSEKPLTASRQSAIINAIFDLAAQFRIYE